MNKVIVLRTSMRLIRLVFVLPLVGAYVIVRASWAITRDLAVELWRAP